MVERVDSLRDMFQLQEFLLLRLAMQRSRPVLEEPSRDKEASMDNESKQATRVLAAIAESSARFLDLANDMRSRPEVREVSHDFECQRSYNYSEFGTEPAYVFDWYVDIELYNDKALWWVLDVYWNEANWVIKSRVEVPGDSGPNTLKEFPDRQAETINQFIAQLQAATSELVDSAEALIAGVVSN